MSDLGVVISPDQMNIDWVQDVNNYIYRGKANFINPSIANWLLGVDASGTKNEYKHLVAGSNVTIAYAPQQITISASFTGALFTLGSSLITLGGTYTTINGLNLYGGSASGVHLVDCIADTMYTSTDLSTRIAFPIGAYIVLVGEQNVATIRNKTMSGLDNTFTNMPLPTSFTGALLGDVTGTQGATSISDSTVTSKLITGYVSGAGTIAASDTILAAIQKLNGNIGAIPPPTTFTPSSTDTLTNKSISGLTNTITDIASATNFTGSLLGDVTGTQGATAIATTTVTGKAITGFVSGAGTVTATDTILTAINKLNGNVAAILPSTFTPSSMDTLTNKSISGATNTLSAIANASLTNSSVTIGSTSVALGATATTISGLTLTAAVFSGGATGSISGSSASFTGALSGDVTGTQSSTAIVNTVVTGKTLAGYVSGAGSISSADTVLGAIQKLNGNIVNLWTPSTTNTVINKAISGATNTLSDITNASLTNSSVTIGSTSVALGATAATIAGLTLTTPKCSTTIGVGGATASASGAGISFPATQSASSSVNTLDDYEEGTWTPTLVCGTSGTITLGANTGGTYTKIGNTVAINCYVEVSSISSPVGALLLQGLPFVNGATNGNRTSAAIYADSLAATATGSIVGRLIPSESQLRIGKYSAGAVSNLAADVLSTSTFHIGFVYCT